MTHRESGEAAVAQAFSRAFPKGAPRARLQRWFRHWFGRVSPRRSADWRVGAAEMAQHLSNVA